MHICSCSNALILSCSHACTLIIILLCSYSNVPIAMFMSTFLYHHVHLMTISMCSYGCCPSWPVTNGIHQGQPTGQSTRSTPKVSCQDQPLRLANNINHKGQLPMLVANVCHQYHPQIPLSDTNLQGQPQRSMFCLNMGGYSIVRVVNSNQCGSIFLND